MPRAPVASVVLALVGLGCATAGGPPPVAPPDLAAATKLAAPSPPAPPELCGDAGDVLGGAELAARLEAEAALQPPDPERTPCALLRLARLRAAEARASWDASGNQGAAPLQPSLSLLSTLVRTFPAWPRLDEVLAELASLQGIHGEAQAAIRTRLALVCRELAPDPLAGGPVELAATPDAFAACTAVRPESRLVPAAWVALADGLVEDQRLLPSAPAAYARALEELSPDDPSQPVLLHRRGLALERLGRHADALAQLVEVLLAPGGAALRQDSLGALARATADPDWDHDGAPDAQAGFDRPELRAHLDAGAYWLPELVERVGDLHRDASDWPRADAAYALFGARWPEHPKASAVAEKLAAVRKRAGVAPAVKPVKGKAKPPKGKGKRGKRSR